ncbi:MAG: carboxypeptidase-like regulatory domain-containing protein, partial [Chitinophagaceae bacterium]|nr:carboxypeptidase-like regulatory domain-containing protein [Chitinophagaceae bacterium]
MNRQTMSLRQVMLMLLLSFFSVAAIAQTQKITGTVVDTKGTPLEGVTVKVQTTNALTTSNKAGAFTINAKTDDLIEFSFVGFESKKVKARNRSLNVVLNAATTDLEDVILVGSRG